MYHHLAHLKKPYDGDSQCISVENILLYQLILLEN